MCSLRFQLAIAEAIMYPSSPCSHLRHLHPFTEKFMTSSLSGVFQEQAEVQEGVESCHPDRHHTSPARR